MVLKLSFPVILMDEVLKWVTRNYIDGKYLFHRFFIFSFFFARKSQLVSFTNPNLHGEFLKSVHFLII